MNITLKKQTASSGVITIFLPEGDYKPKVDAKLKDLARKAVLPGFRIGKVPPAIIKKMYGPPILVEEINTLLEKALNDYIKEQNLDLVADPVPDTDKYEAYDWETQKDFEFDFEIGLRNEPVVDLSPANTITYYVLKVDDQLIDEEVWSFRKEYCTREYPEISEAGDILMGEVQAEGQGIRHTTLYLRKFSEEQVKPFLGLKVNDQVTRDITQLPENEMTRVEITDDWPEGGVATGTFTFTVKSIIRETPAEMNEEFYNDVFEDSGIQTEEEFRAEVKKMLEEENEDEAREDLNDLITAYLMKHTDTDIPEQFLRKWFKSQGEEISDQTLDKEFPHFLRTRKWDMIVGKIVKDYEIKIDIEEVMERVRHMCRVKFALPPDDSCQDKIEAYVHDYLTDKKYGKQNYTEVCDRIFHEKAIELVKEKITLNRVELNKEEYLKAIDAQDEQYEKDTQYKPRLRIV